MTELKRLYHSFASLYKGDSWLGITIASVLAGIDARQAAQRIIPRSNTIWEITEHMISWRENVMQRLNGRIMTTPEHNYFTPIADSSASAWQDTINRFEQTQEAWLHFLDRFPASSLETIYPPNQLTYYEHIQGVLQHDAYHLGQIVMLTRLVKLMNPIAENLNDRA